MEYYIDISGPVSHADQDMDLFINGVIVSVTDRLGPVIDYDGMELTPLESSSLGTAITHWKIRIFFPTRADMWQARSVLHDDIIEEAK